MGFRKMKSFMKEIDCNIYRSRITRVFSNFIVLNTSIKLKINLSAGVPNRIQKLGVLITQVIVLSSNAGHVPAPMRRVVNILPEVESDAVQNNQLDLGF